MNKQYAMITGENGEKIEIGYKTVSTEDREGKGITEYEITLNNGEETSIALQATEAAAQEAIEKTWGYAGNPWEFGLLMNCDKDEFEEMIRDWQADKAPEYDDLEIGEAEIDKDTGEWVAYAHDEKTAYSLTNDGTGNISINYSSTR